MNNVSALSLSRDIVARHAETQILVDAYERLKEQQRQQQRQQRSATTTATCATLSASKPQTATSEAIFVSCSQAGVGEDALIQQLRDYAARDEQQQQGLWLTVDCDRGWHPDPHVPILRALTEWVDAATTQASTPVLAQFTQHLQQSLTNKERDFLTQHIPQLAVLLNQYGTHHNADKTAITMNSAAATNSTTTRQRRPSRSAGLFQSLRHLSLSSSISASASPTMTTTTTHNTTTTTTTTNNNHTALYSCQKRATLFRPAWAKFVYSIAAATAEPTVILFQGLHRGDEVILDMLRHLLRAQDLRNWEQPYLLVTTYQTNPMHYMTACIHAVFTQLHRRQVQKTLIQLTPLDKQRLVQRIEQTINMKPGNDTIDTLLESGCASWIVEKRLQACVLDGSLAHNTVTES